MAVYALDPLPRGRFVPEGPGRSDVRPARTPRRRRREVETSEYVAFTGRILRALSRRVGGDLDALGDLARLRAEVDGAITDAVARLRNDAHQPASWQEIADQLGVTRSAASDRYGKVGGARAAGGQPAHLR
jgi:CRP-like cAMP-binding protein